MRLFRRLSRHAAATNLKEVRKQNRISYHKLCDDCIKRDENKWLEKDETQQYLKDAGANAIAVAYTQIDAAAISYANYIWSLR